MITENEAFHAHRGEFPALRGATYLNFGARGVMPRPAIDAISRSLETLQSATPGSRAAGAWVQYEMSATRRTLAGLIGADPQAIALVESVSAACGIGIWGTRWREGDHALICSSEPPGTWAALRQAADRFGCHITCFDPPEQMAPGEWLDHFAAKLLPSTRLVIASHVSWISGSVLPLDELRRAVATGPCPTARILIDGAQAVGAMPVDVTCDGIDMYAFGAQKWLCGPDGVAALYVSAAAREDILATSAGWRGVRPTADGRDIELVDDARRYESGSAPYALLAGVRRAIELQEALAPIELRAARCRQLSATLRSRLRELQQEGWAQGLRVLGQRADSGITSFHIAGLPSSRIRRNLDSAGIIVREHYLPACIRVCTHYMTLQEEVERFCVVLADTCSEARDS